MNAPLKSHTAVDHIRGFHPELVAIRRDIHAHPELGFKEQRTADLVAHTLDSFGIEVHRGLATTGVVGVIHGKQTRSGRAIGLRADMDCLPMHETSQLPYRSVHAGCMHACGHDGHTTMLLGAARYLAQTRNFDGTADAVFQQFDARQRRHMEYVKDHGTWSDFPFQRVVDDFRDFYPPQTWSGQAANEKFEDGKAVR
jgi:hippurate hydrolase